MSKGPGQNDNNNYCHFAPAPLTSLSLVSTVLLVITQSDSRLYKN